MTLIEKSYWESLVDHHESAPERVWGTAYRIQAARVDEVKEYLDIREINGYTIHYTPFHPADGSPPFRALVYIGTPDNDQFTGPQDIQALAEHIHRSEGPSGLNKDYLWELERALNELSRESGDEHVTDLSNRVRAVENNKTATSSSSTVMRSPPPVIKSHHHHQTPHEFQKVSSVDEQEETEKTF